VVGTVVCLGLNCMWHGIGLRIYAMIADYMVVDNVSSGRGRQLAPTVGVG